MSHGIIRPYHRYSISGLLVQVKFFCLFTRSFCPSVCQLVTTMNFDCQALFSIWIMCGHIHPTTVEVLGGWISFLSLKQNYQSTNGNLNQVRIKLSFGVVYRVVQRTLPANEHVYSPSGRKKERQTIYNTDRQTETDRR